MKSKLESEQTSLINRVGQVRSACYLMAWTLGAVEDNPPETESQRMELYRGMSFVLETTVQVLGDVYGNLNEE